MEQGRRREGGGVGAVNGGDNKRLPSSIQPRVTRIRAMIPACLPAWVCVGLVL